MTIPRPIALTAHDGTVLRGQVWPGGADWVILIHDVGENADLDRWRPLLPHLLAKGVTVLAMDLRGHGASDGDWNPACGTDDLTVTLADVRERAPEFMAVIAAGESVLDALRAAEITALDALILLSPAAVPDPANTLRGAGEAKLFLVGAADADRRRMTDRLQRVSIGWALTVSFPTRAQGTSLLTGPWAGHVGEQVGHFLEECRFLTHQPKGRAQSRVHG